MDGHRSWEGRVPDYTNDVLVPDSWYKQIVASRLRLATGVKNLEVLILNRAGAICKLIPKSWMFDGTALHAPLDGFGFISPTAQFCLLATFAISPERIFRYFLKWSGILPMALVALGDVSAFCTAVQLEMALHFIVSLVAELAARKRVPLLDEPIVAAFLSLDRSLVQSSRHIPSLVRFYSDNAVTVLFLLATP